MNRRDCLKAIGIAPVAAMSLQAADAAQPIQLHLDMEVDPAKEQEMLTNFKNTNTTSLKNSWVAGYVIVSGDVKLGALYEQGSNIRFRRCSQPVCGAF